MRNISNFREYYILMSTIKQHFFAKYLLAIALAVILSNVKASPKQVATSPKPAWLLPIKETGKKVNLKEVKDGYYLSLYEEQNHVEKKATYRRIIREIVSETGVQNGSEIAVSYDPAFEKLAFHSIVIKRNGQVINKLPQAKFKVIQNEENLHRFLYYGYYTAYLILEDIRKGDQIEFSYTITGKNPVFNGKFFTDIYFQAADPMAQIYTSLIISPNRKLNFKSFNNAPKAAVSTRDGFTCYEWNVNDVKAAKYEDYQPSWYNNYPYIQVSEFNNWNEVVNWALALNKSAEGSSAELENKINELKKESKDQLDYFKKCVRFVQDQIRYMGVEMGVYSHKPNTPGAIFKQRYGDCKDKSLLLCTLLKANNIDARMVYVNTNSRSKTQDFLPSPIVFNHAVVKADLEGARYWIDPTIAYQRGPISRQAFPLYEMGLVIKEGINNLTEIGQGINGYTRIVETFSLDKDSTSAILEVNTQYFFNQADNARDKYASASLEELEKSYLDYYSKLYGEVESIGELTYEDNEEENKFTIHEKYKIADFWKKNKKENTIACEFHAQSISDLLRMVAGKERTAPIALDYPSFLQYQITIETPAPIAVNDLAFDLRKTGYRFNLRPVSSNDKVNLFYEYEIFKESIPAEDAQEYIADFKEISERLDYTLTVDNSLTTASASSTSGLFHIALTIVLLAVFAFFARILYKYSLPYEVDEYEDILQIGGWLVVIGLILCATPLKLLYLLFEGNYFNPSVWPRLFANNLPLAILCVFEYTANLALTVFSVLLIILFYKRRNTTPKLMIIFFAANAVLIFVDTWLSSIVLKENMLWLNRELVFAILRPALIIPYLLYSSRVKQTFVFTHPDHKEPSSSSFQYREEKMIEY